ncbi:MAG: response regulator transcription factor [Clostridia bacterium]|nr:response regulator transcription factor [Clostridia bacterium]
MRILFAEDEADLNRILTRRLAEEGYSVDSYRNGADALDAMLTVEYDGAILDIMMPGADGFTVLSAMRSRGLKTPVLFLTARDSVEDRVRGLDAGAADYLVKPFAMEELLARVRALLRRGAGEEHSLLTCGDLTLDLTGHTVSRGGEEIPLSAKEYALLEYLLYNKNRILSREMIEDHIWNYDYEGGTNVVDVYVSYLRRKIDDGRDVKLIRTVRGRGYQIRDPEA